MSLLNILNKDLLVDVIDNAIVLCSYYKTKIDLSDVEVLYNKEKNTFNSKELFKRTITKVSPYFFKFLPAKLLSSNTKSCYCDILLCESFNELAKTDIFNY